LVNKGLEASSYELIVTTGNAAATVSSLISTQMLTPMNSAVCTSAESCSPDTVDVSSPSAFVQSNGPPNFTNYCLVITAIGLVSCVIFTQFLPSGVLQCQEWKELGERAGSSSVRGFAALSLGLATVLVGILFRI